MEAKEFFGLRNSTFLCEVLLLMLLTIKSFKLKKIVRVALPPPIKYVSHFTFTLFNKLFAAIYEHWHGTLCDPAAVTLFYRLTTKKNACRAWSHPVHIFMYICTHITWEIVSRREIVDVCNFIFYLSKMRQRQRLGIADCCVTFTLLCCEHAQLDICINLFEYK